MDVRLIFRNCDGGVITKGGRGRIGESGDGCPDLPALAGSGRQIHQGINREAGDEAARPQSR
jgi:hypothetical protein